MSQSIGWEKTGQGPQAAASSSGLFFHFSSSFHIDCGLEQDPGPWWALQVEHTQLVSPTSLQASAFCADPLGLQAD